MCFEPYSKAIGFVLSVVTLIGIISFLILGGRKGEKGREKSNCLCNSPPLTKLEVLSYSLENEKKNLQEGGQDFIILAG